MVRSSSFFRNHQHFRLSCGNRRPAAVAAVGVAHQAAITGESPFSLGAGDVVNSLVIRVARVVEGSDSDCPHHPQEFAGWWIYRDLRRRIEGKSTLPKRRYLTRNRIDSKRQSEILPRRVKPGFDDGIPNPLCNGRF